MSEKLDEEEREQALKNAVYISIPNTQGNPDGGWSSHTYELDDISIEEVETTLDELYDAEELDAWETAQEHMNSIGKPSRVFEIDYKTRIEYHERETGPPQLAVISRSDERLDEVMADVEEYWPELASKGKIEQFIDWLFG